jgi:hypothetical protein
MTFPVVVETKIEEIAAELSDDALELVGGGGGGITGTGGPIQGGGETGTG